MECILNSKKNYHMLMKIRTGTIILFMSVFFWCAALPAFADNIQSPPNNGHEEGLGISPSKIEMIVQPGKETTVSMEVDNNSNTKMRLTFSAWDFARDEHGSAVPISNPDSAQFRGAAQWLDFPKKPIILPAKDSQKIQVNINIPKEVKSGTHFTYLRVIGTPLEQSTGGAVKVRYALDALFLPMVIKKSHTKQPTLSTKAKMVGFRSSGPWYTKQPITLTAKVRNQGNVHLNFEGTLDIWQGKTKLRSIPVKRTLLPENTSVFEVEIEDIPYSGRYRAIFRGQAFLAKTHKQAKLSSTTRFWYIPRNLIYTALVLIFVVMVLAIWLLRKLILLRKLKAQM